MDEKELMEKWLEEVRALGMVAKGSIRQFRRNCGLKTCKRCASGERHLSHQMTFYQDGKQHSRFVGPSQLEEMKQAIANGRKLEELLVSFGLEYLKMLKDRNKQDNQQ